MLICGNPVLVAHADWQGLLEAYNQKLCSLQWFVPGTMPESKRPLEHLRRRRNKVSLLEQRALDVAHSCCSRSAHAV